MVEYMVDHRLTYHDTGMKLIKLFSFLMRFIVVNYCKFIVFYD